MTLGKSAKGPFLKRGSRGSPDSSKTTKENHPKHRKPINVVNQLGVVQKNHPNGFNLEFFATKFWITTHIPCDSSNVTLLAPNLGGHQQVTFELGSRVFTIPKRAQSQNCQEPPFFQKKPIASMYGIFPYIYHKNQPFM